MIFSSIQVTICTALNLGYFHQRYLILNFRIIFYENKMYFLKTFCKFPNINNWWLKAKFTMVEIWVRVWTLFYTECVLGWGQIYGMIIFGIYFRKSMKFIWINKMYFSIKLKRFWETNSTMVNIMNDNMIETKIIAYLKPN